MKPGLKILFIIGVVGGFSSGLMAANAVDSYLAAIHSIQSFDMTYRRVDLDFPDFDKLDKPDISSDLDDRSTNREVFARGIGWRLEQGVGTADTIISIFNLRTSPASECKPGENYSDFLNPVIGTPDMNSEEGRRFLADLLTDTHSQVSPLEVLSSNANLFGFQVNNPRLRGNYMRVWLDAEHGYLPAKAEWYLKTESSHGMNPIGLTRSMEVDRFIQIASQMWAPMTGRLLTIMPVGKLKGRTIFGWRMELDSEHSSWNSITSDEPFLPKSVPELNYERKGWKYHYPPMLLAAMKEAYAGNGNPRPAPRAKGTVWIIVFCAVVCASCLVVILRAQKKR